MARSGRGTPSASRRTLQEEPDLFCERTSVPAEYGVAEVTHDDDAAAFVVVPGAEDGVPHRRRKVVEHAGEEELDLTAAVVADHPHDQVRGGVVVLHDDGPPVGEREPCGSARPSVLAQGPCAVADSIAARSISAAMPPWCLSTDRAAHHPAG